MTQGKFELVYKMCVHSPVLKNSMYLLTFIIAPWSNRVVRRAVRIQGTTPDIS
jgi:hypothetical protein